MNEHGHEVGTAKAEVVCREKEVRSLKQVKLSWTHWPLLRGRWD
jgi:hypothetical protein